MDNGSLRLPAGFGANGWRPRTRLRGQAAELLDSKATTSSELNSTLSAVRREQLEDDSRLKLPSELVANHVAAALRAAVKVELRDADSVRMLVAAAGGTVLVGLLIVFVLYFLPTIVGKVRSVPNLGSIAVINFFLGFTLVGWVVALAMAARSVPQRSPY